MNATVFFPPQLHWTAQELAEAVPLRLHQLFAFDAVRDGAPADIDNTGSTWHQRQSRNYLPASPSPAFFRVR
jgi:hypothetical protein